MIVAARLVRSSAAIVDAEVMQEQDVAMGRRAGVRPLSVYSGSRRTEYDMALPPQGGSIVTEAYAGFPDRVGTRRLLVLYQGPNGYLTNPCDELLTTDQRCVQR